MICLNSKYAPALHLLQMSKIMFVNSNDLLKIEDIFVNSNHLYGS